MVHPALSQGGSVSPCLYLPEVNAAATVKAGSCCDQNDVTGWHLFLQAFLLNMEIMSSSFGLQESWEMMQTCMLWAWKDESMHEYSPFSSLALISKDTEIIAVLLQICCISDAHKKSRKKEELPRASSWHLSTAVFTVCWGLLCFTPTTGTPTLHKHSTSTGGSHQALDCVSSWRLVPESSRGDCVCKVSVEGPWQMQCKPSHCKQALLPIAGSTEDTQ